MNKELTPLETLENLMSKICNNCAGEICRTKNNGACKIFQNYKQIETALKRLQDIENAYHSLPIDLRKLGKAFEIIKEKFVNITILIGCESLEEYNKHPLTMRKGRLTQEEYDLLKEVLK